jgi:flagellar basal-body rod protein FlgF
MLENTAYIGLSRQLVLQRQMDMIANNIANMNTTAYKAQTMMFAEYLVPQGRTGTDAVGQDMSMVQDVAMMRRLSPGIIRQTGNSLDLAIEGKGYFVIETPDGLRYTRNGRFMTDLEGLLVTRTGYPVLDVDSRVIELDPGDPNLDISTDGTISTSAGAVARVQVAIFQNEQKLEELGNSLYASKETSELAETSQILQGALEGSNVNAIREMTEMMTVLRSYQSVQRLLTANHEMQRRAISTLGKVA